MKKSIRNNLTISLSLLLVMAVLLSGAHAKDVAGASADHSQAQKTFSDDASATVKVGLDLHLHNHVEKQASSHLNLNGDQGLQTDGRSLRAASKKPMAKAWQRGWLEDSWHLFRNSLRLS